MTLSCPTLGYYSQLICKWFLLRGKYVLFRVLTFAKPEGDDVFRNSGSDCNTLSPSGLINVNAKKNSDHSRKNDYLTLLRCTLRKITSSRIFTMHCECMQHASNQKPIPVLAAYRIFIYRTTIYSTTS